MKKILLLIMSLSVLIRLDYNVLAKEMDGVNSTARIEFVKSSEGEDVEIPGITDPETIDPEYPDNPKPNPNPDGKLLRINYVSNFDFGTWGSTSNKIVAYAKAQPVKLIDETITEVSPFVSTIDNRGTERGDGWTLEVTASELKDAESNLLKGAEIFLSNGYYKDAMNAPLVITDELNISQGTQTLATTTNQTGSGQWSLALGKLREFTTQIPTETNTSDLQNVTYTVTDGVRMEIPRNTITNTNEYGGTIHWELVNSL